MTTDVLDRLYLGLGETAPPLDDVSDTSQNTNHRARVSEITVDGLESGSLNMLISTNLGITPAEALPLSLLVWNKTNGNPFYALNFLDMLYRNEMLSRDLLGQWTWDCDQILRGTSVSENLVDILVSRMRSLPDQVRSILQIASFIGHDFPALALVTIVHEEQDMIEAEYSFKRHSKEVIQNRIISALQVALDQGLLETMHSADEFKFAHDKIHEVLYQNLMPDEMERQLLHQRIGTVILNALKNADADSDERYVFLSANNLNLAVGLVDYSGTRYDLIEVNLMAAKLAIQKVAFVSAAEYLRIAVALLQGDQSSWQDRYELCIDVFTTAAETEKNTGMYSRCSILLSEVLGHAVCLEHQYAAHAIKMDALALQGDLKGSVLLGLKVLRPLGIKFPRNISMLHVVKELVAAKAMLGRRSLSALLSLPEMKDKKLLLAFGLANAMVVNCFILGGAMKPTFAALSLRMFRLTLQFGISPLYSPGVLFAWGSVHANLGLFDTADLAEKISFALVDKFQVESVRAPTIIFNYSINHFWRTQLDSIARQEFLYNYHVALSYGHLFPAQTGFIGWIASSLHLDDSLIEVNARTRPLVQELREFQSKWSLVLILPIWQVVLNLCGDPHNANPAILRGEAVDDEFSLELCTVDSKIAGVTVCLCSLLLGYIHEDWGIIESNLPFLRRNQDQMEGYFTMGCLLTWTAACHYEIFLSTGISKHVRYARRSHRTVNKWATTGTDMLLGPNCFLKAMEHLCVKRAPSEQIEVWFVKASNACAVGHYRAFEALSLERLARFFHREKPNSVKCLDYAIKASDLYRRWGALAKADMLEKQYHPRSGEVPRVDEVRRLKRILANSEVAKEHELAKRQ